MTLDTITSKSKTLTHNQIYTKEEEVEDDEFFWHSSESDEVGGEDVRMEERMG